MVRDPLGYKLLNAEIATHGQQLALQQGSNLIQVTVEELYLNPGLYVLGCWIARSIEDEKPLDYIESATSFEVIESKPEGFAYPWAVGPVAARFTVRQVLDDRLALPTDSASKVSIP
jgi:hypothetical protein